MRKLLHTSQNTLRMTPQWRLAKAEGHSKLAAKLTEDKAALQAGPIPPLQACELPSGAAEGRCLPRSVAHHYLRGLAPSRRRKSANSKRAKRENHN